MKPVGLIGGTTWVSTQHYYAHLNRAYQAHFGGIRSAPVIINSVDFGPIAQAQAADDWDGLGQIMGQRARELEAAGCGAIAIGANTMHLCFDAVQSAVNIPVLHIGDGIASTLGSRRTLLLGTRYTMQKPFLTEHLRQHGCQLDLPSGADQDRIHQAIFEELAKDIVTPATRDYFGQLAQTYSGACILLGCTELNLVLDSDAVTSHAIQARLVDSLDCHVDMMLRFLIDQLRET